MFRSLFARLLITIALVLTVSFLILSAILSNFAGEYEIGRRHEDITRTALAAQSLTENELSLKEYTDLSAYLEGRERQIGALYRAFLSNTDETVLLLCDGDGVVLLAANGGDTPAELVGKSVQYTVWGEAMGEGNFAGSDATVFIGEPPRVVSAYALHGKDEAVVGALVVYSTVEGEGVLTRVMTRTVLLSSLWIVVGALVILYLFCERLAGPLREMSGITKRFAKGRFDRRVKVHGNDEIADLGTAFNRMADSLEQLETMRNSFISNVSHDLRTPMTTILGFIEGITSGAIPEEKHDYYLGVIAEEVRRLSRLVTELLDLSRLQSGTRKFNFASFDVCEMARLILISSEQRIDAKHLGVSFNSDADNILVRGDKDAIYQVLYNLCDNAIKFSREGGVFSITITAHGKRKIAVTVYNEGEGIPMADVPFIFERFYKSDKSRSRDKSGAGLGLYIAKTIMESHNETLTLESREGESCAFTFTLPLAGE